jgi:adenine-specific DNA methylase
MMWDYPEISPFASGSGSPLTQLDFMIRVLEREQLQGHTHPPPRILCGSATQIPLEDESCDCVVTDPPYGNSIAYADLSDFFYVWLKRSVGDYYADTFGTPQTPKDQEATSHQHRHNGSRAKANAFYHHLLTQSFAECSRVAKSPKLVSVMFAHQSTEAWQALMSALFDAGLCPDATWPIATERPSAMLGLGGANLESSVTVVCRPRAAVGVENFKIVKKKIQDAVQTAVQRFWSYGFRGADLIVSSYGPAVGVFGKYERVERADGTSVDVPELLELAREAARDAIAGEFRGDSVSTLYYLWANLYGPTVQSWDDARLIVQIGGEAESAMDVARSHAVFVMDGPRCRLALLADRGTRPGLGLDSSAPLIDSLHRAMLLWKREQRGQLVAYLSERELFDDARFWKLAQALFEVMPRDSEDWKLVNALLTERPTLRAEGKKAGVLPDVGLFGRTQ